MISEHTSTILRRAVEGALDGSDAADRANIPELTADTVMRHAKFVAAAGGGLDGRDGRERRALESVLDLVTDHYDRCLADQPGIT